MKKRLLILGLGFCFINLAAMDNESERSGDPTKVLNYNICTTYALYRTSRDPQYRLPRIIQQIKDFNADILCFQEARESEADYLNAKLNKLGYDVLRFLVNEGRFGRTLVTAYNRSKFFCQDTKRCYYKDGNAYERGGNKWYPYGRILALATLYRLKGDGPDYGQPPIHIANTHLGIKEDEKTFNIGLALKLLHEFTYQEPTLWCGNFNLFVDKQGRTQRQMIIQEGFTDLLESVKDSNGTPLSGTFVGYSDDKFIPQSRDELTRLDGMFVRNLEAKQVVCPTAHLLKQDLSDRDELPSDHLPILTSITLPAAKK